MPYEPLDLMMGGLRSLEPVSKQMGEEHEANKPLSEYEQILAGVAMGYIDPSAGANAIKKSRAAQSGGMNNMGGPPSGAGAPSPTMYGPEPAPGFTPPIPSVPDQSAYPAPQAVQAGGALQSGVAPLAPQSRGLAGLGNQVNDFGNQFRDEVGRGFETGRQKFEEFQRPPQPGLASMAGEGEASGPRAPRTRREFQQLMDTVQRTSPYYRADIARQTASERNERLGETAKGKLNLEERKLQALVENRQVLDENFDERTAAMLEIAKIRSNATLALARQRGAAAVDNLAQKQFGQDITNRRNAIASVRRSANFDYSPGLKQWVAGEEAELAQLETEFAEIMAKKEVVTPEAETPAPSPVPKKAATTTPVKKPVAKTPTKPKTLKERMAETQAGK